MINDVQIRKYLLGRLDDDPELVQQIDELILTDPEFSTNMDILEDEIIEEYLEGSLNAIDKHAVERHFLRPPERQRKLRSARLLSRHLAAVPLEKEETLKQERFLRRTPAKIWPCFLTTPIFRTCAEIAALILFATSILYFWNQQRKLEIAVKQSNLQVAQEREHSAALDRQLQVPPAPARSSAVMLSLATPGLLRGDSPLPQAKLTQITKTLHLQVVLTSQSSDEFRVQLKNSGSVVWSQSEIRATAVRGGSVLALDIPADALPLGTCELSVVTSGRTSISYWFLVSKLP